ncbi:sensor histidine kinase [Actinoplanes regularis]|uniref:histidine kinase n=1 Tax=Actinoplanes regularis TaxID=52697 RepID=A0A238X7R0_9ACTN|nr:HAMP domain-containing sensor histidine kinase [Actinoplanes regularis]GIE86509.1 two-component sensor histidine kinase [Actinoplanes regularis]SNR54662.1 two-component system, OmpR family, sensor kinase [Actinoplanes regularis]
MRAADPAHPRPARWRSPAGWPLRTRLVTTMIALLAVLGLVVGGTAELYLKQSLYDQIDDRLGEVQRLMAGGPRGSDWQRNSGSSGPDQGAIPKNTGGQKGPGSNDPAQDEGPNFPPGARAGWINLTLNSSMAKLEGGLIQNRATPTMMSSGHYIYFQYQDLTDTEMAALLSVDPGEEKETVSVGNHGNYRVSIVRTRTGRPGSSSDIQDAGYSVLAIPLSDANSTLLAVAGFTGCVILGSLLIAGWAGALIIRRTLKPLDRVAATASRVAELRLDRGAVQLAQRVPEADTDPRTEVGQVGAALNRMLDHVGNALEARHASEMQVRQFVADASHELRTPLAAIRGYAELSRRSRQPIPDELAHVLGRVESEAKRMTTLVEDLLLLARLDAGRPLAQDPVDLTMLAVDATSDAHAAGPRHYWQLDLPDEPVTVIGDGARLHQVVANLLANARTHTPEGSTVTVKVGTMPNAAVLQVIDNGPGINPELVPHIFERFARGDSSRSRAAGSTGLGLSIVHAVVSSHRGKVGVQSRPGQTIFTVMLPHAPQAIIPTAELHTSYLPGAA